MTRNPAVPWSMLWTAAPLLGAPVFLLMFYFKRASSSSKKPTRRKRLGYSSLTFSIGLALQNLECLANHNAQHVIMARLEEDADDDGQGDPDDPAAQLNRQLRRIRGGEALDRLILRLRRSGGSSRP